MSVYQLGLYEKAMPAGLTWSEKMNAAREAGFDHLEISIDETEEKLSRLNWTSAQRGDLLKSIRETGVPVRSVCLSGHRMYPMGSHDASVRTRSMEIMEKAIELSAELGVRIIQLAGYDVYYEKGDEGTRERFSEGLARSVEMAASRGVLLGFETMETPFMDTVTKAMAYVLQIDSPYLGVYPDIGNLKNASLIYGTSVNVDLAAGRGHIMAAHLKETIPGHYREIPFGTGHTEYVRNLEVLRDLGVRLFVGEFWYKGSAQWREELSYAGSFLRGKLDAAFGKK